ncbi:hypothetical protein EVU91_07640 [Macrococcoides bohemicum]|uniref:hypothetical protein n=1 Tax=Macrococcoides bohemicum TaxID=1903056 RepID=UPI00105A1710|nr:hypothetical protein [Macrococcus bohemicus]QYA45790.1 hypothetical protein KYI13_05640 [Macrococcus bohemicus]TDL36958.1 hypothetical protein EVU91_07640 [Macrococcus bohemicus]
MQYKNIFNYFIFFIALSPLTFIHSSFFIVHVFLLIILYYTKHNVLLSFSISIIIGIVASIYLDVSHFYLMLLYGLTALYNVTDDMHLTYYVQSFFVVHLLLFLSYHQHFYVLATIYALCMIFILFFPIFNDYKKIIALIGIMIATFIIVTGLLITYQTVVMHLPSNILKNIDYKQMKINPRQIEDIKQEESLTIETKSMRKIKKEPDNFLWVYALATIILSIIALILYKRRKVFQIPQMQQESRRIQYVHQFKTINSDYKHLPHFYMKHLKKLESLYIKKGFPIKPNKTFAQNFCQVNAADSLIDFIYEMRYYNLQDTKLNRKQFISHLEAVKNVLIDK